MPNSLRLTGRFALVLVTAGTTTLVLAAPAQAAPPEVPKILVNQNFADPDVVRVGSTWYAYPTNDHRHLPVASAPTIDGPWTVRAGDAMPGGPAASWAVGGATWAPDVHVNPDGTLTLTYTAAHRTAGVQCIGVATATSPLGPFTPVGGGPLICPTAQGGAIDASTFVASNGARYLLWKNDGNRIGVATSLWLTPVTNNGTTVAGGNTRLLTNPVGQVIEAPDLVQRGGRFILFYSGGPYSTCAYHTWYATASAVGGPYMAAGQAFMHQGNTGVCGPGGADVVTAADGLGGGDKVIFHGWIGGGRPMLSIDLSWVNDLPVQGGTRAVSLDGDGRAEIAAIQTNGQIQAWHNDRGFAARPYGNSLIIGDGFTDPARVRFADLDDDGRAEVMAIQTTGEIQAWHNDRGFAPSPYGTSVIIGTGFTDPARVRFADLNDDGRAELINIQADGQIMAWHNDGAFAQMPYGVSRVIATGFAADKTTFADVDGDGRADLIALQPNGEVRAWHNDLGFSQMPFGQNLVIASGFTDLNRTKFADLDDDGRAEIMAVQTTGEVQAWHNDAGFAVMPYGNSVIVADGFTDPARTVFIS
jgi:hypothetical protein